MFTFYNAEPLTNFLQIYHLLLNILKKDNKKYSILFDFIEKDEELEIGNLIIRIKDDKNCIIYQNCIPMIYHKANLIIQKLQLQFIEQHYISLPYFTRNYKKEIDSYHIRNTKFELIQKLHCPDEIRKAEEIQKIALKKHYHDNSVNIVHESPNKIKKENLYLLINAILNDLNTSSNQHIIYIDYQENKNNTDKFNILIKNQHNNTIFYKDLELNKKDALKITNQIRDTFIENCEISLPSFHKDELDDTLYHHLRSNKNELVIRISNENEYQNAIMSQEQALIKLQKNYENTKIYTKKS